MCSSGSLKDKGTTGKEPHCQGTVGEKFAVEHLQKEERCHGAVGIVQKQQHAGHTDGDSAAIGWLVSHHLGVRREELTIAMPLKENLMVPSDFGSSHKC